MTAKRAAALLTLAILTVAGSSIAATTPAYWAPARMAAVAPTLPGPLVVHGYNSFITQLAATPKCVGIGTAKAGSYPGFRCAVAWKKGFIEEGTGTLWVRPQARGFCVSSTGFASCPAAPRTDDPRLCPSPRSSADRYAEYCTTNAARNLVNRAVRNAVNLGCTVRSVLVIRCEWIGGAATVTFSLGAVWKSTVALSG